MQTEESTLSSSQFEDLIASFTFDQPPPITVDSSFISLPDLVEANIVQKTVARNILVLVVHIHYQGKIYQKQISALLFRNFTKCAAIGEFCPQFPVELAVLQTLNAKQQDQIKYFFGVCVKYVFLDQSLRESAILKTLLTESQQVAEERLNPSVLQSSFVKTLGSQTQLEGLRLLSAARSWFAKQNEETSVQKIRPEEAAILLSATQRLAQIGALEAQVDGQIEFVSGQKALLAQKLAASDAFVQLSLKQIKSYAVYELPIALQQLLVPAVTGQLAGLHEKVLFQTLNDYAQPLLQMLKDLILQLKAKFLGIQVQLQKARASFEKMDSLAEKLAKVKEDKRPAIQDQHKQLVIENEQFLSNISALSESAIRLFNFVFENFLQKELEQINQLIRTEQLQTSNSVAQVYRRASTILKEKKGLEIVPGDEPGQYKISFAEE